MLVSVSLAVLDAAALGLLAIALSAMVSSSPVKLPVIGAIDSDGYVWLLLTVSLLIIGKSILSMAFQWVATRRFAQYELEIGDKLFDAYLRAPWTDRLKKNTAQLVRLADVGIANTISGFLMPSITLPTLLVTSIGVVAVIVIAEPITALVTILYLGAIAALLNIGISRRAVQAGRVNRDYGFRVAMLMTDMVSALKEITLRDKAGEVAHVVHENRIHTTRARANLGFLGAVPKFVIDAGLVGGFLLVGGVAYLSGGLAQALSAVALFGVAGFRLVPSLTGFQSVLTNTSATAPQVQMVIDDIRESRSYIDNAEFVGKEPIKANPVVLEFKDVSFEYPGAGEQALHHVNLTLPIGSTLALVGVSGAGKTTLVDMLLGLLTPSSGTIELDGRPLENVLGAWRQRVGYVPQEVTLFDGTIAQNVALTWGADFDRARVEDSLRRAQVWDVVESRVGGIDSRVGDRGLSLSGGQRQRLGIARALYTDPLVLVLDEATSALDTKTESEVVKAIRRLRGEVTVVSVAHRLATIRDNDQVCFLRGGELIAKGSFDELVREIPDFATQAALAGLH